MTTRSPRPSTGRFGIGSTRTSRIRAEFGPIKAERHKVWITDREYRFETRIASEWRAEP